MNIKKWILVLSGLTMLLFTGCQSVPKKGDSATVMVGDTLVDLKQLAAQVHKDPQARSAVTAVNSAFGLQDTGVKYCPVDGQRFSKRVEVCPQHGIKLLPVE